MCLLTLEKNQALTPSWIYYYCCSMSSAQPKAYVFDAYGTLFDVFSLEQSLMHHFGPKAAAINALWRQKQLAYTWLRTLMGQYRPFSEVTLHALQYACEAQAAKLAPAIRQELMQQYMQLQAFEEVPEVLGRLSAHFKLAILSNADRNMLDGAARHNGLLPYLSEILSADDIGLYKPRPEVYQMVSRGLRLELEEVVFVSANAWDVAGAAACGLRTIWLRRADNPQEKLGFKAWHVLDSLNELPV
ncbi:MAG: haloacid dehalogenase type II [Bacteroidetes bacterium]|nr:MAG: haloacid dehalogenase type II [Bacteroidota bacterium]